MHKIFENTKIAFSLKKDSELERAYFLFKMIANQPLVRMGTAITNFALQANLPVEGLIRATVFDHFCGGISEDDCLPVIDKMYTKKVCSVLDYSVEGKENEVQFQATFKMTIKLLNFVKEKDAIPFAVFKPTGFGRIGLYEKIGAKQKLTVNEQEEWDKVVMRYHKVCALAKEKNVRLLIDAEESWMQNSADDLIEEMMEKYNTESAIVYNTLQMYRHDRMAYLKKIHQKAIEKGYYVGVKLVRGAYLEKENKRAQEKGYPTPICKNKPETDANFNEAVCYMLENHKHLSLFAGTHNENSSYLILQLLEEKKLSVNNDNVWFGQLYGMSDHITYNLADLGYNVAKYLPFGPVKDVMPYLIRRAEENTSVAGQTTRELKLLKIERKRRKL